MNRKVYLHDEDYMDLVILNPMVYLGIFSFWEGIPLAGLVWVGLTIWVFVVRNNDRKKARNGRRQDVKET